MMTRLPNVLRQQLPANDRTPRTDRAHPWGRLHTLFQRLAHPPLLVLRRRQSADALRQATRLAAPLRALARLTVGALLQREYAAVPHAAFAQRLGICPEPRARLAHGESDPAWTEQERAVIRYATEATHAVRVTASTLDALEQCLEDGESLELVLTVAFYNLVLRVLVPLESAGESRAPEPRDQG